MASPKEEKEDLRRIQFLNEVRRCLESLKVNNDYGIIVRTVAFDSEHLEQLNERSRLPAIHIMHGAMVTIDEGPTETQIGDLGDIVEVFPVLLRCTVKGPEPGENEKLSENEKIEKKSFQAIKLRHAVEKVLVGLPGQYVLRIIEENKNGGIVDTKLTSFSLPKVQENWGSPWLEIEMNYEIIHTYRKGRPV